MRFEELVRPAWECVTVSFRRDGLRGSLREDAPFDIMLGRTENGRYWRRGVALLSGAVRLFRRREALKGAEIVVVGSPEMVPIGAGVYALLGFRATPVYQVVDVPDVMWQRKTLFGVAGRMLEKGWLRRSALVIMSSPAFIEHIGSRQGYSGKTLVLENKPMRIEVGNPRVLPRPIEGPPWQVGYFGAIRCRRSVETLLDMARRCRGAVQVKIAGYPTFCSQAELADIVDRVAECSYVGPFDAVREAYDVLYGASHFVWAVDWYDADGNSRVLLPNRIYYAAAYGCPVIAEQGTATGKWVEDKSAGVVLQSLSPASLAKWFLSLSHALYADLRRDAAMLPHSVWQGESDRKALIEALRS